MDKETLVRVLGLAVLALIVSVPDAAAYERWSENVNTTKNCATCHGPFRRDDTGAEKIYVSPKGASWGVSLHAAHTGTILGAQSDCNYCHYGTGIATRAVSLNSSSAAPAGTTAISCSGCHGRLQDANTLGDGPGWGAGLRQHHQRAGVTECLGCHGDASPASFTPVGESIPPPWYATFQLDPCNVAGRGENFYPPGDTLGNDNDGDDLYDTADSDCGTNQPPVANNDTHTTAEDTPLIIVQPGVLGNDTDPESNPLTAIPVAGPAHGTLTLNSNGGFIYTPALNYSGPDSFTYKANDGTADSNVATVAITVTALNDAPVAADDAYSTAEDTPLTVAVPGVLGNDTDADGNPMTAALVLSPAHGTVTLNANGSFTYTPAANYNGPDTFTYQASDGVTTSNAATVTITVTAVNDPPVAAGDAYSTSQNPPLTVAAPGVLGNDTDPESNPLTAIKVTDPAHGTVTLNADGSFTYTPAANYNGPDSFTYKANDGTADSNVATVTVVTPGPQAGHDVDGDRKADLAVYRPSTGTWFLLKSSTGNASYSAIGWGLQAQGDVPLRGDFDGDRLIDPTVYRPSTGTWFILESSTNYTTSTWFGWGNATDKLVPADYDGDGRADAAVYRSSTGEWYIRPSNGAQWSTVFGGQAGDLPMPGDFDGDTKTDLVIYRPATGTWFILTSSSGFTSWYFRGWGVQAQGDTPVPGDYDGDRKTDVAVYRPGTGTWFVLKSSANDLDWAWFGWGSATDVPVPADYDGDSRTDLAVYRPSTGEWYVKPSDGSASWSRVFGQGADVPLQRVP